MSEQPVNQIFKSLQAASQLRPRGQNIAHGRYFLKSQPCWFGRKSLFLFSLISLFHRTLTLAPVPPTPHPALFLPPVVSLSHRAVSLILARSLGCLTRRRHAGRTHTARVVRPPLDSLAGLTRAAELAPQPMTAEDGRQHRGRGDAGSHR